MNIVCPVCEGDTRDFLSRPYLDPLMVLLARRVNPAWRKTDGMCRRCWTVLNDTSALAQKHHRTAPRADGYRGYFRYVMTKRESAQWHHVNPDIRRWRRGELMDRAAERGEAAGFDAWLIIDVDETLVGQGVAPRQ